MAYRIIADENIEPYTRQYLGKLGHDIEWIGDVSGLGLSSTDREIATYSRRENRLVLTQDDDFFTELDLDDSAGILFQADQSLTGREVGDIVHEISQHVPQTDVDLEYVSSTWL